MDAASSGGINSKKSLHAFVYAKTQVPKNWEVFIKHVIPFLLTATISQSENIALLTELLLFRLKWIYET